MEWLIKRIGDFHFNCLHLSGVGGGDAIQEILYSILKAIHHSSRTIPHFPLDALTETVSTYESVSSLKVLASLEVVKP